MAAVSRRWIDKVSAVEAGSVGVVAGSVGVVAGSLPPRGSPRAGSGLGVAGFVQLAHRLGELWQLVEDC